MANSIAELQSVIPILPEYLSLLKPWGYIGDYVAAPLNPLGGQTDDQGTFKYNLEVWSDMGDELAVDTKRAIGMEASQSEDPTPGVVEVKCFPHARKTLITETELASRRLAGPGAAERLVFARSEKVFNVLRAVREYTVSNFVTTHGNYNASFTSALSGTAQFSDATSDPLDTFVTVATACRKVPIDSIAIDFAVYLKLIQHPQIVALLKSTDGQASKGFLELELGKIFRRPVSLHVATATYNAANTTFWGKHMVFYTTGVNPEMNDTVSKKVGNQSLPMSEFSTSEYPASFRTIMPGMLSSKIIDRPEKDHKGAYELELQGTWAVASALIDAVGTNKVNGAYLLRDVIA